MAVRTQQGFSGLADPLQLYLMADAVAGLGQVDPMTVGNRGNILVIVRVLKAGLQGVVIDVGYALFCLYTIYAHGFKLQVGHGAGGVLCQGLINADGNLAAGNQLALDQMGGKDFLCYIHGFDPPKEKKCGGAKGLAAFSIALYLNCINGLYPKMQELYRNYFLSRLPLSKIVSASSIASYFFKNPNNFLNSPKTILICQMIIFKNSFYFKQSLITCVGYCLISR